MPDLTIPDIDATLYARLQSWAREQHKPLPALAREILAAADRAHEKYDPTMSPAHAGFVAVAMADAACATNWSRCFGKFGGWVERSEIVGTAPATLAHYAC